MNFNRTILLILLSITLTACGHLTDRERDPTPSIGKPPTESVLVDESTKTKLGSKPTIKSQPVVYQDLLNRLSAGFRLAELKSKHVEDYQQWAVEHPAYLTDILQRAEPYLYHIVGEIEKRGLPLELALLPAVESAFKPDAISRSGATGLWQFMPSTAKYLGLGKNWWYDGSKDLIASTGTALDYLTKLNKQFDGDWFLALAAYNGGNGTISRAIKHNDRKGLVTNYQNLQLRSETTRYVPKLIALKNIINDPKRFNIKLPFIANLPYFDKLALPGQINLNQFADRSGIDIAELNNLNSGFLRWATPPGKSSYLLVPIEKVSLAKSILSDIKLEPQIEFKQHQIARGETLSEIAKLYGVTTNALKTTNKLKSNLIRAGKMLLVPLHNMTSSSEKKSTNKLIHKVIRGNTLWSIGRHYKVKVEQLLMWNKLSPGTPLKPNQLLVIYR